MPGTLTKKANRREFIKRAGSAAAAMSVTIPWRPLQAAPPVWSVVPDQIWRVGVPVNFDLADYVTDPDGDLLTLSLDNMLPEGLMLTGTVISGTPTVASPVQNYVAVADDGQSNGDRPPAPTEFEVR